jgi:thiamine-phosphate pyrophosphorylase
LADAGIDHEPLVRPEQQERDASSTPIPIEPALALLDLAGPGDLHDALRILDASANRAGEGLRVVEDYVRFVLDDPQLTRRIKDVRHRFAQAVQALDVDARLDARDTTGDVGTHISTPTEQARENPRAVLAAAFRRTAEALRSLEEFTKLSDIWLSGRFEILRYDTYTLEKLVLTAVRSHASLDDVRLCVLVGDSSPTLGHLTWIVSEALAGGAQMIQLRDKDLPDRERLTRAREVRILTHQARAAFILNDRPDLARLAGADGVHLGQDDLTTRDARRILGPRALLGRSSHNVSQLDQATLEGASYLGVGPVFPSRTKSFEHLAGLAFVCEAHSRTNLPWYAIGGIDATNVDEVLDAGARRIAVSSAITRAERPRDAAADLRARIDRQ